MRISWMLFLIAGCAYAQFEDRLEISFMFGGVSTQGSIQGQVISGSIGYSSQYGTLRRVKSTDAGTIWIEVPMTFFFERDGTVGGATVASLNRDAWFFTPGIRYRTPMYKRVSLYALAGGGYGALYRFDSVVSGPNGSVTVNSTLNFHPAFDYGGGVDVRLARTISLRAEGRSFVTAAALNGLSGHNHPVFLGGLIFHF